MSTVKLKIGDTVTTRMLGSRRIGKIQNIRETGMYDVLTTDGTILPNIGWHDLNEKRQKPWYIVSKDISTIEYTSPETGSIDQSTDVNSNKLYEFFEEQKQFTRGAVKK